MPRSYIKDSLLAEYIPSYETEKLFSERSSSSNWADGETTIDFFISYSTHDKELAIKFAKFLMDQLKGCTIYLYSIDIKTIKDSDDVSTERIEEILSKTNFVLFLQSINSIESFWCAWELGYITALGHSKCIIVRINSDLSFTKHREYLKLYPRLMIIPKKKTDVSSSSNYLLEVLRPDERLGIPLKRYLNGERGFLDVNWEKAFDEFTKQ